MLKLAAAVLVCSAVMLGAGDGAEFKSAPARIAQKKFDAAKRVYVQELRAALQVEKRNRNEEAAQEIEDQLAILEGEALEPSLRSLMSLHEWNRIVSDGNNMRMSFNQDGTITMRGASAWNQWEPRDGRVVINGDTSFTPVKITVLYGVDGSGNNIVIVPTDPKSR